MQAIRLPASCADIRWGSPPRSTRRQRNSAVTIRRPTRAAMERATVSTSGSSGMRLREVGEDIVALYLDRVRAQLAGAVVIVLSGVAVELPQVPGAHHPSVHQVAEAKRPAAVRADAVQGRHRAVRVAQHVGASAVHHLARRARGQAGEAAHSGHWHTLSVRYLAPLYSAPPWNRPPNDRPVCPSYTGELEGEMKEWVLDVGQDLRFAARAFGKRPGFTA